MVYKGNSHLKMDDLGVPLFQDHIMKHMNRSVTATSGKLLVGKLVNHPVLKFWSNNDQLVMHTSLATHKTSARSDTRELSGKNSKHVSIILYIYIWILYLEFPFAAIPLEFAIVSAHSPSHTGRAGVSGPQKSQLAKILRPKDQHPQTMQQHPTVLQWEAPQL